MAALHGFSIYCWHQTQHSADLSLARVGFSCCLSTHAVLLCMVYCMYVENNLSTMNQANSAAPALSFVHCWLYSWHLVICGMLG